jgi:4-hydroxybenzoate polyprenyltransferase
VLWLFVLGTVLMRSAGCAINDYADRNFDAHVERTPRPPARRGRDPPWEALASPRRSRSPRSRSC